MWRYRFCDALWALQRCLSSWGGDARLLGGRGHSLLVDPQLLKVIIRLTNTQDERLIEPPAVHAVQFVLISFPPYGPKEPLYENHPDLVLRSDAFPVHFCHHKKITPCVFKAERLAAVQDFNSLKRKNMNAIRFKQTRLIPDEATGRLNHSKQETQR